jgi:hypothetical protein
MEMTMMRRTLGTLAAVLAVGAIGISGDGIEQDDMIGSAGAAVADRTFQYDALSRVRASATFDYDRYGNRSLASVSSAPDDAGSATVLAIDNTGDGVEDVPYRWDFVARDGIDSTDNQEIDKNAPNHLVQFPAMADEARTVFVGSLAASGANSDLGSWGDVVLVMAGFVEDWFDEFEEGEELAGDLGLTGDEPGAEPGEPDKYYPTGQRIGSEIELDLHEGDSEDVPILTGLPEGTWPIATSADDGFFVENEDPQIS